jgi:ATP phosphoribosyltransferase regulatory subunit
MSTADRWLLPDGVDELLPEAAQRVEQLRRQLLDLFRVWGYELVIPSLVEFTESLLIGLGNDVELHSYKVTDQCSGRMMAIRPDITPQAARIDAHSLKREGPVRLCYADSVLHTRPKSTLASRSAIQVGAELYGEPGAAADIEIICLMVDTLKVAGLESLCLDLGHVGIFRYLARAAQIDAAVEAELFDALQRKSTDDIRAIAAAHVADLPTVELLVTLAGLHGDVSVLDRARSLLLHAPDEVAKALDHLQYVASEVQRRHPEVACYFDLAELRGYHYHTGLVFAAYTGGYGEAIANGGRYDNIGQVFGRRARPATGFSTELKALANLNANGVQAPVGRIFAPYAEDLDLWAAVQVLRKAGEIVIFGNPEQALPAGCDRELILQHGEWHLDSINRS